MTVREIADRSDIIVDGMAMFVDREKNEIKVINLHNIHYKAAYNLDSLLVKASNMSQKTQEKVKRLIERNREYL